MTSNDIMNALHAIDPAALSREEWLKVGMALKHEGAPVSQWDTWSSSDSKRYHPGECEKLWAGFRGSSSPVTIGSVVNIAKRFGYQPPRRDNDSTARSAPDGMCEGICYAWDQPPIMNPNEDPSIPCPIADPAWVEGIDVEPPADDTWNPAEEVRTYLTTLFEANDYVGYVVQSHRTEDGRNIPKGKGYYDRTAGELLAQIEHYKGDLECALGTYDPLVGAWIRPNPLDGHGIRDENVTAFRYALIESDTLDIDKQAGLYKELDLPVAILVHSGGKSLHAIVRIDATTRQEYRDRVDYLHKVCKKSGLEIDTQNKNPSRLSRLPGMMRNGQKQYIVAVNQGKASWAEWKEYIEDTDDDLPKIETFGDILGNLPPLAKALIEGVLREGHKMLLSGPSKAGKSFGLLELTAAIAEGREWFGRKCAQGKVLYVNLEVADASCFDRIDKIYKALGWEPKNAHNIDVWNLRGKAVPMDRLAPKLIRKAKKNEYKAVIIDPIYKVITGDENAADKMAHFCNQFDRVCTELKCAVIYCHHHSKGAQGQKSAKDRSSGSGVFARDPDVILDMIELVITPDIRKALENKAQADAVTKVLDEAGINWQNDEDCSQDDMLKAETAIEYARTRLNYSQRPALDVAVNDALDAARHASGWRIEYNLREFKPTDNKHLWFRYPLHTVDGAELLADAKADGEEPVWKSAHEAKKEKKKASDGVIKKAIDGLVFDRNGAMIGDVIDELGGDEAGLKKWLNEHKSHSLCSDGAIRKRGDVTSFEILTVVEKLIQEQNPLPVEVAMKETKRGNTAIYDAVKLDPRFVSKNKCIHLSEQEDQGEDATND